MYQALMYRDRHYAVMINLDRGEPGVSLRALSLVFLLACNLGSLLTFDPHQICFSLVPFLVPCSSV